MGFLAATWWIWLIVAALCFIFIFVSQAFRMKKIFESDHDDDLFRGFFSNMIVVGIVGSLGWICGILFIIGVVALFVLS